MIARTICLKLHKPSNIKRRIIEEAMRSYTAAFDYLLEEAQKESSLNWEDYEDYLGDYRGVRVSKWINSERNKELNKFGCEPFKDSLKMDFGATFAGYLNLKKLNKDAGFPGSSRDIGIDRLRPILFCRYSQIRDYCLLYDEEKKRFYVKMYLMNNKSELKRNVFRAEDKKMYYVGSGKVEMKTGNKKERFIIIPLSFGERQEKYLKRGLINPEIFKTARLVKRENDFYLYINIILEAPEKVMAENYMGVCRSLKSPVHYAIIDQSGKVIKNNPITLNDLSQSLESIPEENKLHIIANKIIKKASKYKAQIVVENLAGRGDILHWTEKGGREVTPFLTAASYRKLCSLLKYKAEEIGLPSPVKVSPSGVFYTCPQCGQNHRDNRLSMNMFLCTACGKAGNLEELGSINLAGRLIKYNKDTVKVKARQVNNEVIFSQELLEFNCKLQNNSDIMDNLGKELKNISENFYSNNKYKSELKLNTKKISVLKKLSTKTDILSNVEIVFND